MPKESRVEIPSGSGNFYRYSYDPASRATIYLGPVGSSPDLGEEEFLDAIERTKELTDYHRQVLESLLWDEKFESGDEETFGGYIGYHILAGNGVGPEPVRVSKWSPSQHTQARKLMLMVGKHGGVMFDYGVNAEYLAEMRGLEYMDDEEYIKELKQVLEEIPYIPITVPIETEFMAERVIMYGAWAGAYEETGEVGDERENWSFALKPPFTLREERKEVTRQDGSIGHYSTYYLHWDGVEAYGY